MPEEPEEGPYRPPNPDPGAPPWPTPPPPQPALEGPNQGEDPEPLDEANQIAANVAERMIQRERDGPLTRREWAAEEGYRSGFLSSYGRKKMRG